MGGGRLCFLVMKERSAAIREEKSLPSVPSRPIGQYAFNVSYAGLSGLCRTMVNKVSHLDRYISSSKIAWKM